MPIDVVSIGATAIAAIGGLFKSKKHYNLYYFEEADDSWKFVMDGHPSQVNPVANQYKQQGIVTAVVRNKDDKYTAAELMPKEPPAGYQKNSPLQSVNWTMVFLAGGAVAVIALLIKRRKR